MKCTTFSIGLSTWGLSRLTQATPRVQRFQVPIRLRNDRLLGALSQVAGYRVELLLRDADHTVAPLNHLVGPKSRVPEQLGTRIRGRLLHCGIRGEVLRGSAVVITVGKRPFPGRLSALILGIVLFVSSQFLSFAGAISQAQNLPSSFVS